MNAPIYVLAAIGGLSMILLGLAAWLWRGFTRGEWMT